MVVFLFPVAVVGRAALVFVVAVSAVAAAAVAVAAVAVVVVAVASPVVFQHWFQW